MSLDKQLDDVLGDPPWDDSALEKSWWITFSGTREYVNTKHPGALLYRSLESVCLSLEIFLDAVEDLISSINMFKADSIRPGFWHRPNRAFVDSLEIRIQRGISSSASCAMALVDHARNFSEKYHVPNYKDTIKNSFCTNPEHRFVQGLRNYIAHVRITKANWQIIYSEKGRMVRFILSPDELVKWDEWPSEAKDYIKQKTEGINVEELFNSYSTKVRRFHSWFNSRVMDTYSNDITDYLRCERFLDKLSVANEWRLLLSPASQRDDFDPYIHLGQYLSKQEREEVFSLPYKSKAQVDRIISLIDEHNACTEELRQKVYSLFKVSES
ncbi:hypothetical protein KA005_33790 [bacterium]|nr:hypothetical protein [bacterium]